MNMTDVHQFCPVDGATVKWQTAVDGMNTALTAGDYQWILGTDGLPVLQKKQ